MALSVEEKDRRRQVRNDRNRAHSARMREFDVAERVGKRDIEAKFAPELAPAEIAVQDAESAHATELENIDRQIAALQAKRQALVEEGRARYRTARGVVTEIWDRKREDLSVLDVELGKQFPDLAGQARWSAVAWRPIE